MTHQRPTRAAEEIFRTIKRLPLPAALARVEQELKKNPTDDKLLCKSAQLLAQNGYKEQALERVRTCMTQIPHNSGTWTTAMIVYSKYGFRESALDAAREGLKQAPDAYVYNKASELFSDQDMHDDAITTVTTGMQQFPNNHRLATTALKIFAIAGEKERALKLIDDLEKYSYKDSFMRTTIANVLLGYNQGNRAWHIINSALPQDKKGRTVHAQCALSRGDIASAKKDLTFLNDMDPQSPYTHQVAARIAYQEGRMRDSVSSFNRFITAADKPCPFDALVYISITGDENPVAQHLRSFFEHKPKGWLDEVVSSIRSGHLSYAQLEEKSRAKLSHSNILIDGSIATRAPINRVSRNMIP